MSDRQIKRWITVNGNHIPIYEGESNYDALDRFYTEHRQKKSVKVGEKDIIVSQRKKRIDQKDLTDEKIFEEIVGEESYTKEDDYKAAMFNFNEGIKDQERIRQEISSLEKELEGEMLDKPEEEWTDTDRIQMNFFNDRPQKYTEKGEQISSQLSSLRKQATEAEHRWSRAMNKMEAIDIEEGKKQNAKTVRDGNISTDLQEDYFGFATGKTTTPRIDDALKNGSGYVVEMSPKRYIQECAFEVFGKTIESTLSGRNAKDVAKYMTMMEKGVKFHTPYINYQTGDQEGLHRALAAYMLGIDKIPVAIIPKRR